MLYANISSKEWTLCKSLKTAGQQKLPSVWQIEFIRRSSRIVVNEDIITTSFLIVQQCISDVVVASLHFSSMLCPPLPLLTVPQHVVTLCPRKHNPLGFVALIYAGDEKF